MTEGRRERCARCGALAALGDEWCGQCYARLGRTADASPTSAMRSAADPGSAALPPAGAVPPSPGAGAPPMPVPASSSAPDERAERRTVDDRRSGEPRRAPVDRRVGEDRRSADGRPTPASLLSALWAMPTVPEPDGLAPPMPAEAPSNGHDAPPAFPVAEAPKPQPSWPCAVCGTANPLELDACEACGAPFARLFHDPVARPDIEPRKAMRFSLLFPGLGHAKAGRKAEGVARGILFLWCAGTAILLLLTRPSGGLGILAPMAIVFVLGSIAWYAITAMDAYRIANGEDQIVTPKVMLYSVAGLMMLSVGSVFIMVTHASHVGH